MTKIRAAVIAIPHPTEPNLYLHGQRDDNTWSLPAGHMIPGETPHEAAKRELREETGLENVELGEMHDYPFQNEHIHLFFAKCPENLNLDHKNDPDQEFKSFKWLDPTSHGSIRPHKSKNALVIHLQGMNKEEKKVNPKDPILNYDTQAPKAMSDKKRKEYEARIQSALGKLKIIKKSQESQLQITHEPMHEHSKFDPRKHDFIVKAHKDGKQIGYLPLTHKPDGIMPVIGFEVHKDHRGQGVGTDMMNYATRLSGKPYKPAPDQTNAAKSFAAKYRKKLRKSELTKAHDPYRKPSYKGQIHPVTGNIADYWNNQLVYFNAPDVQMNHDRRINDPNKIASFLSTIKSVPHRNAMAKIIKTTQKDPARHVIPTEKDGVHQFRARNVNHLLFGSKDYIINTDNPSKLSITKIIRHGSDRRPTTYNWNLSDLNKGEIDGRLKKNDGRRIVRAGKTLPRLGRGIYESRSGLHSGESRVQVSGASKERAEISGNDLSLGQRGRNDLRTERRELIKAIPEGYIYVAFDGDNAGNKVEQAAAKDDIAAIKDISKRIKLGSRAIKVMALKAGGKIIIYGGDDVGILLPKDKEYLIEKMRKKYFQVAKFTITAGIAENIPEAVKALLYGKLTGKNKTVKYTKEIDEKLKEIYKPKTQEEKIKESGVLDD